VLLAAAAAARAQEPIGPVPQLPAIHSDFRLSASPDSIAVRRGSTGTITVKVEPLSGFQGGVTLLSSLLYSTATSFSPPSIKSASGTSVLSISPSNDAIKGSYVLSITGVDDGNSHSITVRVTVK
jgi:hypothetical protein